MIRPLNSGATSLVILTGAGMSTESGVPTFRGEDRLWEGHHIEMVASPEGYERDPKLAQRFYNLRRAALNTSGVVYPAAGFGAGAVEGHRAGGSQGCRCRCRGYGAG